MPTQRSNSMKSDSMAYKLLIYMAVMLVVCLMVLLRVYLGPEPDQITTNAYAGDTQTVPFIVEEKL